VVVDAPPAELKIFYVGTPYTAKLDLPIVAWVIIAWILSKFKDQFVKYL
jgi:hypothetical protein